jgi:PhzF family phenazine biosynthesis protein
MKLNIDIVDAFTSTQFGGNSAAVIITETWLNESLMQAITAENNLSETAFLVPVEMDVYDIRWFSPLTEIAFCGHATLASAFVLFNKNPTFHQVKLSAPAVGDMLISKLDNGFIEMDFPSFAPEAIADIPEALIAGLSIKPHQVLKNQQAYFAVYNSEFDVRAVEQSTEQLKQLAPLDVVVTAPGEKHDFVSRYFWPANGGDEDPVTGSIHTGLAPYWSQRLNKTELKAYQASKRGGELLCIIKGDRVKLRGQAVHYLSGSITVNYSENLS